MASSRSVLHAILDVVGEDVFFADYWATKPVVFRQPDPELLDGLFDLNDLEEYLFVARPPAGEVQLVRRGQWPPARDLVPLMTGPSYSLQALYRALAQGYTITLNATHRRWPKVKRLVTELEDRLQARAQTNVYITGQATQGFDVHADDHDVFVLQTYGAKRWVIYDKPPPGGSGVGELLHEFELRKGDAIYLPAGFPHAAATRGEFSIHLALGIFPYTWYQLLVDLIDDIALRDSEWLKPLPLSVLEGTQAPPSVAELEERLRAVGEVTDLSAILEGYRNRLTASERRSNPAPSGYLESVRGASSLEKSDRVQRRPGVGCCVNHRGERAEICFMGQTIRVPGHASEALRFIANNPGFRIEEVPGGLSDDSKLVLVRRLIQEGLLQVER